MHPANASAPEGPALGSVEGAIVARPAAVCDPAVAVEPLVPLDAEVAGLGELPAHPATRTPLTIVATPSRRARGHHR
jgi:hypothetical protein